MNMLIVLFILAYGPLDWELPWWIWAITISIPVIEFLEALETSYKKHKAQGKGG